MWLLTVFTSTSYRSVDSSREVGHQVIRRQSRTRLSGRALGPLPSRLKVNQNKVLAAIKSFADLSLGRIEHSNFSGCLQGIC